MRNTFGMGGDKSCAGCMLIWSKAGGFHSPEQGHRAPIGNLLGVVNAVIALFALSLPSLASTSLEKGFENPSDEYALQAWYHWVGSFVTEKGITADLEAMKSFGISTVHIFGPGHESGLLPQNAVAGSDAWFEKADFAAREAVRLGLSLGAHNCPGWTSSGGPWIRPEDSMKDIVSSCVDVTGGVMTVRLPQPTTMLGFYRDIAVFAFPWTPSPRLVAVHGSLEGFSSRTFEYEHPWVPKSIWFDFRGKSLNGKMRVEGSPDGQTWEKLQEVDLNYRHMPEGVPCIGDLPPAKGDCRFFRVSIGGASAGPICLVGLRLEAERMIPAVHEANGAFVYPPGLRDWGPSSALGIDKAKIVDLTGRMGLDGSLAWMVPTGTWRIVRLGYTPIDARCGPAAREATGLECDKLSRRGLDAHWPHMPARYLSTVAGRQAFRSMTIDSYELPGQTWTEDFAEQFAARRGYAPGVRLLSVVGYPVGTWSETSKFLYDFSRTTSDLFADNYYGYFTELCRRHGIRSLCETYDGAYDHLHCASCVDIPAGEIWDRHNGECMSCFCRMAACVSHVVGGSGAAAAEAFTGFHPFARFETTPADLRIRTDDAWARGINQIVYHSYVHQPWHNVKPGLTLGSHGTQLNRHTTWWPEGRAWSDYVRRGQYLLRTGIAQADVLVIDAETGSLWNALHTSYPDYSHDLACMQSFWRLKRVNGGVQVPGDGNAVYPCVVLTGSYMTSLRTLRKIRELVSDGADVAVLPPVGTPTLGDDGVQWKQAVSELFGGMKRGDMKRIGNGRLLLEDNVPKAASAFGVVPSMKGAAGLGVVHRRLGRQDIYYLANTSTNKAVRQTVSLACTRGLRAEFWNAWDGTHGPAPIATAVEGRADVFVDLPPARSVFVVFAEGEANPLASVDAATVTDAVCFRTHAGKPEAVFSRPGEVRIRNAEREGVLSAAESDFPMPQDLSTGWSVAFRGLGASEDAFAFPHLVSWSEREEDGIRHFAGRGIYRRTFSWRDGKTLARIVLDLGDVRDVAKVTLNGKPVATLLEAPYVVDVTEFLIDGENALEVEVVNCWPNRLIGDAKKRAAAGESPSSCPDWAVNDSPRTGEGPWTWSTHAWAYSAKDALVPAGLLGPVSLRGEVVWDLQKFGNRRVGKSTCRTAVGHDSDAEKGRDVQEQH